MSELETVMRETAHLVSPRDDADLDFATTRVYSVPNTDAPAALEQDVQLAVVLDEVRRFVRRFVVLTDHQAVVLALWAFHTHAFDAAETTPYVSVTSAEKRSGKSRLLEVLEMLVRQPLVSVNVSDAALFRAIHEKQPTVIFDEIDSVFGPKARDREDLRGLLNAGFRTGAVTLRMGGKNNTELQTFNVYCPKVFAGIGELPDTIRDRCIRIRLERRTRDEAIERFRRRDINTDDLAATLSSLADHLVPQLCDARPSLPDELDDRAQDVWEPLLAIADLAGEEWPVLARAAAVALSTGIEREDDSLGARLLQDVYTVFAEATEPRFRTVDLIAEIAKIEESPWGDWKGKTITSQALSGLLKPYRIRTMPVWVDGQTVKGYKAEQFTEAWLRVLGVRWVRQVRSGTSIEAGTNPPNPPNPHTPQRVLPDEEVRRLLEQYRPELIGANHITTPAERREIASTLALYELGERVAA
jgi:hypothetical protein